MNHHAAVCSTLPSSLVPFLMFYFLKLNSSFPPPPPPPPLLHAITSVLPPPFHSSPLSRLHVQTQTVPNQQGKHSQVKLGDWISCVCVKERERVEEQALSVVQANGSQLWIRLNLARAANFLASVNPFLDMHYGICSWFTSSHSQCSSIILDYQRLFSKHWVQLFKYT